MSLIEVQGTFLPFFLIPGGGGNCESLDISDLTMLVKSLVISKHGISHKGLNQQLFEHSLFAPDLLALVSLAFSCLCLHLSVCTLTGGTPTLL